MIPCLIPPSCAPGVTLAPWPVTDTRLGCAAGQTAVPQLGHTGTHGDGSGDAQQVPPVKEGREKGMSRSWCQLQGRAETGQLITSPGLVLHCRCLKSPRMGGIPECGRTLGTPIPCPGPAPAIPTARSRCTTRWWPGTGTLSHAGRGHAGLGDLPWSGNYLCHPGRTATVWKSLNPFWGEEITLLP